MFDFKSEKQNMEEFHFVLDQDIYLFGEPHKNELYFRNSFFPNAFTKTLRKIQFTYNYNETNEICVKTLENSLHYCKNLWVSLFSQNSKFSHLNEIKENDMYRCGKQVFKVSKIHLISDNRSVVASNSKINQKESKFIDSNSNLSSELENLCKICLDKETNKDPFLKNVCKCSQQIPVHFRCMRKWLYKNCII